MHRQERRTSGSPFLPAMVLGRGADHLLCNNIFGRKRSTCHSSHRMFCRTRIRHLILFLTGGIGFLLLLNFSCVGETCVSISQDRVLDDTHDTEVTRDDAYDFKSPERQNVQATELRYDKKDAIINKTEENIIEKLEYQLLKSFMRGAINSHTKRLAKIKAESEKPINYSTETKNQSNRINNRSLRKTDEEPSIQHGFPGNISTAPSSKKIVLYTHFFGHPDWLVFTGNKRTDLRSCPVANCIFTTNRAESEDADAVIFHDVDFRWDDVPRVRFPHQRYIWLILEAPGIFSFGNMDSNYGQANDGEGFFNWTSTYHRGSDIFVPYGGLRSLRGERDPARFGLLNKTGTTYTAYLAALENNEQLTGNLDFEPGQSWPSYLSRPKLVTWMVSHCSTLSGRELYVKELQKYIPVDVYGACGPLKCGQNHLDTHCYQKVLSPNYKFYLAFENSLCQDYITEKVWMSMQYGLVPVVYGGARYQDFLPPSSYVDATNLTPRQLAQLLTRIAASPEEYARYHLWRRYWEVLVDPPLCDLCERLHTHPTTSHNQHSYTLTSVNVWWKTVNNCTTKYPLDKFPRLDLPVLFRDFQHSDMTKKIVMPFFNYIMQVLVQW